VDRVAPDEPWAAASSSCYAAIATSPTDSAAARDATG